MSCNNCNEDGHCPMCGENRYETGRKDALQEVRERLRERENKAASNTLSNEPLRIPYSAVYALLSKLEGKE